MYWEEFISGKCSVYCRSRNEAAELLLLCDEHSLDTSEVLVFGSSTYRYSTFTMSVQRASAKSQEEQWFVKRGVVERQISFEEFLSEDHDFSDKEFLKMLEECGL